MINYMINTPLGFHTPASYSVQVNFGLTDEQIKYWTKRHQEAYQAVCENKTYIQFDTAWVEDMFTELNYHEEVKYLQTHAYTNLLK